MFVLSGFAKVDRLWHTGRVKRPKVVISVAVVGALIVVFLAFDTLRPQTKAVLPMPNGYDDFAAAAQWLVAWNGNLLAPPEVIRTVLNQNAKALETLRGGLKKPSAVPVTNTLIWFNAHIAQLGSNKQMAQLLVAEGLVHLEDRRTNEAARSFADCILFAHASHRRGLLIDELVAIAGQAMGAKRLVEVAPYVSSDALQEIVSELIALDQSRESAGAVLQRDADWSRESYGIGRSILMRILSHKSLRSTEASFAKKHSHSVAALRLTITELAIRGYTAKNGKPPLALTELVPAWLPAVPLDPFGSGPLIYHVTTNSFLLYSVGPDGKDDQGAPIRRGGMETGDLLPTTP